MENLALRRYSVYEPEDRWRLIIFIFYAVTLVKPIVDSVRGWRKVKDAAWFIHPFMCFVVVLLYGLAILKASLKNLIQ